MGKQEILDFVKECILETVEFDPHLKELFASEDEDKMNEVLNLDFYWELGMDSLSYAEFLSKLEQIPGISSISDEDVVYVNTVGDMVNYLYKKINID